MIQLSIYRSISSRASLLQHADDDAAMKTNTASLGYC